LLLNDGLGDVNRAVKVVGTIEIIKGGHGRETAPVVEGLGGTDSWKSSHY
jgi:hypothetical protein